VCGGADGPVVGVRLVVQPMQPFGYGWPPEAVGDEAKMASAYPVLSKSECFRGLGLHTLECSPVL
jgi:hypothetical protein